MYRDPVQLRIAFLSQKFAHFGERRILSKIY